MAIKKYTVRDVAIEYKTEKKILDGLKMLHFDEKMVEDIMTIRVVFVPCLDFLGCQFRPYGNINHIFLNEDLLDYKKDTIATLIHEVAHAVEYYIHDNEVWQEMGREKDKDKDHSYRKEEMQPWHGTAWKLVMCAFNLPKEEIAWRSPYYNKEAENKINGTKYTFNITVKDNKSYNKWHRNKKFTKHKKENDKLKTCKNNKMVV